MVLIGLKRDILGEKKPFLRGFGEKNTVWSLKKIVQPYF
jgi:hypothetical protein